MKNIVLTGFMGTGKTEVGRELARLLDLRLIDVDTEIEKSAKMTVNDIFGEFGEPRFRDMETEMVKEVSKKNNVIISTGGGVVLKYENMEALRQNGLIVCLSASPETIFNRLRYNSDRPLLRVGNPLEKIKIMLDARMPCYENADITIETDDKTPLQIAEEIVYLIRSVK